MNIKKSKFDEYLIFWSYDNILVCLSGKFFSYIIKNFKKNSFF